MTPSFAFPLKLIAEVCLPYRSERRLSEAHFWRTMLWKSAAYAVARCLSVRLAVCHVRVLRQNE